MKLPEKIQELQGELHYSTDYLVIKINEIIDYLTELHEQQKPKELCIKGGNFACTCEECNKKRMDNLLN